MSMKTEYLNYLVYGGDFDNLPKPTSVNGMLLYKLCQYGGASEASVKKALDELRVSHPEIFSGISEKDVKKVVDDYLSAGTALDQQIDTKVNELLTDVNGNIINIQSDLINIMSKRLLNGFDINNVEEGCLNDKGGISKDNRFVTSDYFEIQGNTKYYSYQVVYATNCETQSYFCFYDENKTFIQDGYHHDIEAVSPINAKYARVSCWIDGTTENRLMFTSIENTHKYYSFGYEYSISTEDVLIKANNNLYGKTMVVLGDSMAKGHTLQEEQTWAYKIASRNNMNYTKLAVNGSFITTGHDDDSNCLIEQVKKIEGSPDIIVIHMGTNDRSKSVDLGTWTYTNHDTTNLNGSLRTVFEYIAKNFTDSQVMFITPYYVQENVDYIGTIEKACMYVGIHCKNNKQGGIWAWNDDVKNKYFMDSVHLNELGQERVSHEYESFMRTFM